MPIYEYQCDDCKGQFDDLVGTFQNYPEPTCCKLCSSQRFSRIISRPGFVSLTDVGGLHEEESYKNKAWLETPEVAAEIRSGAREMHVPKGFPPRFQPKV